MKVDDMIELLNRKEALHPELERFLVDTPAGFKALKHPLVFAVPFFPGTEAMQNASFKHKSEYALEQQAKGNYSAYISIHERPYRLEAFLDICDKLDRKTYWELVRFVWVDTENAWEWVKLWKRIFKQECAEKHFLMDDEELEVLSKLPDRVRVWRGCTRKNERGISWTLNREKAVWFANRYKAGGHVLEKVVDKRRIVAYFGSRGESEVIIP